MDLEKKITITGLIAVVLGISGIILSFNIEIPTGMIIATPLIVTICILSWFLSSITVGCGNLTLKKYMPVAVIGTIAGTIGLILATTV